MKKMLRHVSPQQTPQSQPIPGRESDMTKNYAGAYAFKADIWTRLNRFLIIGSEGGTYYASEQKLTLDNMQAVRACVNEDGLRAVREIAEISKSGQAPKNDQAILALAYCLKKGDLATRRAAESVVNDVCRIGTHIFQLAEAIDTFGYDPANGGKGTGGGWGPIVTRAVANWYNSRRPDQVAFQAVKYQRRGGTERIAGPLGDNYGTRTTSKSKRASVKRSYRKVDVGWSHADLLKLSHVARNSENKDFQNPNSRVYAWILDHSKLSDGLPRIIEGFLAIHEYENQKTPEAPKIAANLIRDFQLPREAVPSWLLNESVVWEALLENMPMTAMIRNLGKMSSIGLLASMSDWTRKVSDQLRDTERLRKARVHPINIAVAMKTYASGRGVKGDLTWTPNQQIVNALDDAFYGSFDNIEPINKRVLVAIDKSGSMLRAASGTVLSAQECAAIMAMVTVKKSSQYYIVAYDAENGYVYGNRNHSGLVELQIDPRQRLDDIVRNLPSDGGGTDASLPIRWAAQRKIKFDAICLYSDGESWAGHQHATQSLDSYRRASGINTLFVTCDTVSNATQLTDDLDVRSFHCAGFDEQAPKLIQDFINSAD